MSLSFGLIVSLLPGDLRTTFLLMATIEDVQRLALDLPESQRATLAADLLGSLSPVLHEEDEGVTEALRRDAELDANPAIEIGLEEFDRRVQGRRG